MVFSVAIAGADSLILWSEVAGLGAARHEIALVLRQDGVTGRESLAYADEIRGIALDGVLDVRVQIGYSTGSTNPSSLRIEIRAADWKIPSGDVTVRFPGSLVKLNGRGGSAAEGDDVVASVQVSRGLDVLKIPARELSDGTVILRVGMSDKSWLDVPVPTLLFKRSFTLSSGELSSLRAAKGL